MKTIARVFIITIGLLVSNEHLWAQSMYAACFTGDISYTNFQVYDLDEKIVVEWDAAQFEKNVGGVDSLFPSSGAVTFEFSKVDCALNLNAGFENAGVSILCQSPILQINSHGGMKLLQAKQVVFSFSENGYNPTEYIASLVFRRTDMDIWKQLTSRISKSYCE